MELGDPVIAKESYSAWASGKFLGRDNGKLSVRFDVTHEDATLASKDVSKVEIMCQIGNRWKNGTFVCRDDRGVTVNILGDKMTIPSANVSPMRAFHLDEGGDLHNDMCCDECMLRLRAQQAPTCPICRRELFG